MAEVKLTYSGTKFWVPKYGSSPAWPQPRPFRCEGCGAREREFRKDRGWRCTYCGSDATLGSTYDWDDD